LNSVLRYAGVGLNELLPLEWHDFRHAFASRLGQGGISIYRICKWLSHSDIKVTQIYAHFAPVYDDDIEKPKVIFRL